MNVLWVFNPENDIALGNNLRHFTPPRNALLLRESASLLPFWMADDGDMLLGGNSCDRKWLENMCTVCSKDITLLSCCKIGQIERVNPWGWSNAIACELARTGIPDELLPAERQIKSIRRLSHRHSSIIINRCLQEMGIETSVPTEVREIATLERMLRDGQPLVIKSPWSSSGRGVISSGNVKETQLLKLADGMIRHQGSVLVEKKLDRILDFAMLFEMKSGVAEYIGLSVFDTDATGNYSGNIVASEHYLSKILSRYTDSVTLYRLRKALEGILTELLVDVGDCVCGVDMLVYPGEDGVAHIAPCIELNLRRTMGHVAHCLYYRLLRPGNVGRMRITHKGYMEKQVVTDSQQAIFDSTGHLMRGRLSLIPENNAFDISLTVQSEIGLQLPV